MEMPDYKKIPDSLNYYISKAGLVTKCENNIFIPIAVHNHRGYRRVSIKYKAGHKIELIHRLVLKVFVRLPSKTIREEAAHLNGQRDDNRLENLQWCTCKENNSHKKRHGTYLDGVNVPTAKLTPEKVTLIKYLARLGFYYKEIARVFNVSQPSISRIIKNQRWVNHGLT